MGQTRLARVRVRTDQRWAAGLHPWLWNGQLGTQHSNFFQDGFPNWFHVQTVYDDVHRAADGAGQNLAG